MALQRRLVWAVLFCGLLVALALIALRTTTVLRSSSMPSFANCYQRLYSTPIGSIEIVALGSSRMMFAFDPGLFETQTTAISSGSLTARNLAHPSASPSFDFHLLEALTRQQHPNIVLFELNLDSARNIEIEDTVDPSNHASDLVLPVAQFPPMFFAGLPLSTVVAEMWDATDNAVLKLHYVLKSIFMNIEYAFNAIVTGRLDTVFKADADIDERRQDMCRMKIMDDLELQTVKHDREAEKVASIRRLAFDETSGRRWLPSVNTQPHFLTPQADPWVRKSALKLVALARDRGIVPIFLNLPMIYSRPPSIEQIADVAKSLNAIVLSPNADEVWLKEEYFIDHTHLTQAGRKLFMTWLAERLKPHLSISR